MGNFYSKQSDGVTPTPSGRSESREAAYREDIVIANAPDKTVSTEIHKYLFQFFL